MIEGFWRLGQSFLTAPDSNRVAQAFFGIMMLVAAWRFAPAILATIPALSTGGAGRSALRGFLDLGIIATLALVMAASVGTLVPAR